MGTKELVDSLTPEQVENIIRVWEKNHSGKAFQKNEDVESLTPKRIRVQKAFRDFQHGWCVAFVDDLMPSPVYFKTFEKFVSEYTCLRSH